MTDEDLQVEAQQPVAETGPPREIRNRDIWLPSRSTLHGLLWSTIAVVGVATLLSWAVGLEGWYRLWSFIGMGLLTWYAAASWPKDGED